MANQRKESVDGADGRQKIQAGVRYSTRSDRMGSSRMALRAGT